MAALVADAPDGGPSDFVGNHPIEDADNFYDGENLSTVANGFRNGTERLFASLL